MRGPAFRARLRLLATEDGGRRGPLLARDYRPTWDLGTTWRGAPCLCDGRVLLDDVPVAPGGEGLARIEPLVPEHWAEMRPGRCLTMQEGARVVGHATILELVDVPTWWSADVAAFVVEARAFVAFVGEAVTLPLALRLEGLRTHLLRLYAAALRLPSAAPTDRDAPAPRPRTAWPDFAHLDLYREVFHPYRDDAPSAGSLADDVRDDSTSCPPGSGCGTSRPAPPATRSGAPAMGRASRVRRPLGYPRDRRAAGAPRRRGRGMTGRPRGGHAAGRPPGDHPRARGR